MACGLRFLLACGILVPPPGIEPVYAVLQGRFLTTGPPGKSSPKKLLGRYSYPYFTAEKNKAQQSAVIHPRWGTKTQTKLDLALIDGKTALSLLRDPWPLRDPHRIPQTLSLLPCRQLHQPSQPTPSSLFISSPCASHLQGWGNGGGRWGKKWKFCVIPLTVITKLVLSANPGDLPELVRQRQGQRSD